MDSGTQPPGTQKPPTPAQKQNDRDDPKHIIQNFLKIVNKLHKQENQARSEGAEQAGVIAAEQAGLIAAEQQENNLKRSESAPIVKSDGPGSEDHHILKLQRNLRLLKGDVVKLQDLLSEVAEEVWKHIPPLELLLQKVEKNSKTPLTLGMKKDLDDINKKIFNLMCQVPLLPNKRKKDRGLDSDDGDEDNNGKGIVCLPGIHATKEDLKRRAVFRYVLREFEELTDQRKICLLSFAVFPENQEVNRKMLMYWWIGEGILSSQHIPSADGILKPEDVVKDILDDFTERNLIEPVEIKRKVKPSSYKMAPFVHSSVVLISKEIRLFDMYDEKEKPTMKQSELHKVCLVEGSSRQLEAEAKRMEHIGQIDTVFNVSERFPEFTCKWFTRMKNLRVLYLGRWERIDPEIEMDSSERTDPEIVIDSRRVMKNLSSLRRLRFLSFQGISTIKSLSRSACKLNRLIILDLRHCYNLEQLPDDIHKLKNLVYLDLTGCEALESVPMGLARLYKVEVLKGFVLGDVDTTDTCKLKALKRLVNLRKLSVIVHREGFPIENLFDDIKDFEALENLKVRWGSKVSLKKKQPNKEETVELEDDNKQSWRDITKLELPTKLRKLALQRFPDKELPEWLWPRNLIYLEKLHLGSSKRLKGFGALPGEPTKCCVKVLRLTSLLKLKVEWRDLKKLYFPNLILLETYECPRVTFCPCDRNGIWRSEKISDKNGDSTTTL